MSDVKILNARQLIAKKFFFMEELEKAVIESFGKLTINFVMIIWGHSGNGKTNLIIQLIKSFLKYGEVLYISYEEGHGASMQRTVITHLSGEFPNEIRFADHTMTLSELSKRLKKKRSEQFIIIDSLQYFAISYEDYKALKEEFPRKAFIYLSHTKGKLPDGKTGDRIRYDSDVKVFVDKYIAFVISRFGGNKPFVIWEEGAINHYGKKQFEKLTKAGSKTNSKLKLEKKELDL